MQISHRWVVAGTIGFGVVSTIISWYVLAQQNQKIAHQTALLSAFSTHIQTPEQFAASQVLAATTSAMDQVKIPTTIDDKITALTTRVTALETQVAQLAARSGVKKTTSTSSGVKESLLYLGSGSTISREWTDIPGAQTDIDTSNFVHVVQVRFEAGLSIIGGEARARLVNKTTGAVFYDSEVMNNTVNSMWKYSPPLHLPSGLATYGVQLRSTSGETANLTGARVRITIQ